MADKEHFKALLLDTKNRLIKMVTISIGTLNSSIVHPREVFRAALAANASAIIVGHNHPSGDLTPSPEDRNVTLRLAEAGKILGIDLLDHLIIGDGKWISMRERGML
jgi:DNA repair protein RadC